MQNRKRQPPTYRQRKGYDQAIVTSQTEVSVAEVLNAYWKSATQHYDHDQTTRVVGYLADLYDAWGKPELAAEWRAKLPTEQDAVAPDPPADERQDE